MEHAANGKPPQRRSKVANASASGSLAEGAVSARRDGRGADQVAGTSLCAPWLSSSACTQPSVTFQTQVLYHNNASAQGGLVSGLGKVVKTHPSTVVISVGLFLALAAATIIGSVLGQQDAWREAK